MPLSKRAYRRVVGILRPGMRRVHYFILECGHGKIDIISASNWDETNDERQVHQNWLRNCVVCCAEKERAQTLADAAPKITPEYVDMLLKREYNGL